MLHLTSVSLSIVVWVVQENIHTHAIEGHWKFQGRGRSQQPKFIKESMKLNWKPSIGELWIYSAASHCDRHSRQLLHNDGMCSCTIME